MALWAAVKNSVGYQFAVNNTIYDSDGNPFVVEANAYDSDNNPFLIFTAELAIVPSIKFVVTAARKFVTTAYLKRL